MIPPLIEPGGPPGEVLVFESLKVEAGTEDWIVLHSVDIPQHIRQVEGEADFLILAPGLGVLCLEVKSHLSVARAADGMWRLGRDAPTVRSPFRQAAEAMQSLIRRVKHLPGLAGVPFVSAVCFPQCNFNVPAMEWESWQVLDERLLNERSLRDNLERVLRCARKRYAAAPTCRWFEDAKAEPTSDQCESLLRVLRGSFEVNRSPKARRQARDSELRRYTEEQFGALDALEDNQHVLLTGAAGTGKTLIALEAARREHLRGRRTLLCCYNRLLGDWLKGEAAPLAPTVEAGTLHSLMLRVAGVTVVDDPKFWSTELPDAAADALLSGHELCGAFEVLVIDEAQDLAAAPYLDVLDLLARGGLQGGRVLAFGDFARQALYECGGDPVGTIASRLATASRYNLGVNCRNRPRIGSLVSRMSSLGSVYREFRRPDDGVEPDVFFYEGHAHQLELLERELDRLRAEGFALDEIAVLSIQGAGAVLSLAEPWRGRIADAGARRPGRACASTTRLFKGLEAPAVVVTDVTDVSSAEAESLLYVAMSRPTDRLVMLADSRWQAQLWDLFWRRKEH